MAEGAVIRLARVVENDDEKGGGRIKARTIYDNKTEKNVDIPFCVPLLPKMLHVVPKIGELVLVISMAPGDFDGTNFYIGPIISQESKLFHEEYTDAIKITEKGYTGWDVNPKMEKGCTPTLYPATEDISIEGRKDTGIQLKEDEVRIKAGVKTIKNRKPKINTETPSFISLKYYPDNDYERDGFKSTATVVADKINLFGTHTDDPATSDISVTGKESGNKDTLIPDSTMTNLLNKAHQLPYGDTLIEFLEIFREAFEKHIHPFPTMAPCNDENMKAVTNYDLNGILSDNVRIN